MQLLDRIKMIEARWIDQLVILKVPDRQTLTNTMPGYMEGPALRKLIRKHIIPGPTLIKPREIASYLGLPNYAWQIKQLSKEMHKMNYKRWATKQFWMVSLK